MFDSLIDLIYAFCHWYVEEGKRFDARMRYAGPAMRPIPLGDEVH